MAQLPAAAPWRVSSAFECGLGGVVFRRPGADIAGAGAAGERQVLSGEKGQTPACQDRQGAALPVPGLCRVEREV